MSWRGKLYKDHILSSYTTWQIGGPARYFYQPLNIEDLKAFLLAMGKNESVIWLGAGSKVLIKDSGIKGVVIHTRDRLNGIGRVDEITVRAEAGVSCAKLIKFCLNNNLVDVAFLAGIPGTVGGALVMNAGAFGGEIWHHVISVETIDRQGTIKIRQAQEFKTGYRLGVDKDFQEWFLAANLRFTIGDTRAELKKIQEHIQRRRLKQPLAEPSCGSVFKNPINGFAGQIIESLGLKGLQVGAAVVSPKHANFIVNQGGASAQNVEDLIEKIRDKVKAERGINLELETRILG